MNNEIKEILQLIGDCCYYGKISVDKCEKYCNDITNLQEENKKINKELQTSMDICNNRLKEIVRLNNIIDKALCSIASCNWNDKYVVETYDILKGSEDNEKK